MTKEQAFRRQAQDDFAAFLLLKERVDVSECQVLHYLQMATEKTAKAVLIAANRDYRVRTHATLKQLLIRLRQNGRHVAPVLGYRSTRHLESTLLSGQSWADQIELLHPQVSHQVAPSSIEDTHPNVEYPWQGRTAEGHIGWIAPADHSFGLLRRLNESTEAKQLLDLLRRLLARFDTLFP